MCRLQPSKITSHQFQEQLIFAGFDSRLRVCVSNLEKTPVGYVQSSRHFPCGPGYPMEDIRDLLYML